MWAKFGAKDKAEKDIIREVQVLTHLYLAVRPDKAGGVDGLLQWKGSGCCWRKLRQSNAK